MNCKDFLVGDKVIVYRLKAERASEDKVVKVGRKYVTTDRGYRFKEDEAYEFSLVNRYEYGETFLLFKNEESIIEHQNKKKALSNIRNVLNSYQLGRYKKADIDKILEILKEGKPQ